MYSYLPPVPVFLLVSFFPHSSFHTNLSLLSPVPASSPKFLGLCRPCLPSSPVSLWACPLSLSLIHVPYPCPSLISDPLPLIPVFHPCPSSPFLSFIPVPHPRPPPVAVPHPCLSFLSLIPVFHPSPLPAPHPVPHLFVYECHCPLASQCPRPSNYLITFHSSFKLSPCAPLLHPFSPFFLSFLLFHLSLYQDFLSWYFPFDLFVFVFGISMGNCMYVIHIFLCNIMI